MKIFTKMHFARLFSLLLLLTVSINAAWAQRTVVTGRVIDDTGAVVGGAVVTEKNTQNVVLSDEYGNYSIRLTTSNPVLVFSFLGNITQEIAVATRTGNIDVTFSPDVSTMDEVVVIAYGTQRKVSVLGAQSAASGETIRMPTGNLSNAISGRLSGVVAVTRSGEPGHDSSDIWIRGLSTGFNQSSNPLILVDGVERSLDNIDPEDVEGMTVLKDASATAVYGVRGANGVILVTTKPGKVGTPKFSFDYYEGVTRMTNVPKMADVYTYMDAANESYRNEQPNNRPLFSSEYIVATKKAHGVLANDNPMMYNEYLYPAVDWIKEIFNNWGHNRHANFNVRGGAPSANYYVSLSYYNELGQTKNFELTNYNTKMQYNRYNFTSNLNLQPTSRTKIDLGFSGYLSDGHYPELSGADLFNLAIQTNPTYLPKGMPDGTVAQTQLQGEGRNPLQSLSKKGFRREFNNQLNSNIRITQKLDWWDWSKGLSITGLASFDAYNSRGLNYTITDDIYWWRGTKDAVTGLWNDDIYTKGDPNDASTWTYNTNRLQAASNNGQLSFGQSAGSNRTTYLESSLNYDRVFGDKHRVSGLLLYNQRIYRDLTTSSMDGSLAYKSRGYAGRVTYSYDDRYLFEANVGINGSENFSPSERYGTFPAFALGWVASNESFWEGIRDVVSYLKIRYTHGYVGSDTGTNRRFMYQAVMSGSTGNGIYGVRLSPSMGLSDGWGLVNYGVNVGWSRSLKQDIGVDMTLFDNKLSITIDLFKEHRDKIFLQRAILPAYAGFVENPWANLGIVENKGIEGNVEYMQSFSPDVSLTVRGNFTYNKSEIIENDQPVKRYSWMEQRGTALNATWGYTADGLFTSEEEVAAIDQSAFGAYTVGDIRYKDLNGDGVINNYDVSVIGKGDVPRFYYGFGFDLRVKNFSIGALFQGIGGVDRIVQGSSIHPFSGSSSIDNVYSNITDRWSADDPTNTDVFYPRLTRGTSATNNRQISTWWKKDVSFLRLKQLNISYNLPKHWVDRTFIDSASIYVMGTNLLTFSKFKLWDPELNTNNGVSYPNTSNYTIGVKFSF